MALVCDSSWGKKLLLSFKTVHSTLAQMMVRIPNLCQMGLAHMVVIPGCCGAEAGGSQEENRNWRPGRQ